MIMILQVVSIPKLQIQMMLQQSQSATSSLRRLCQDIQTQINKVLANAIINNTLPIDSLKSQVDQQRTKFQRTLQDLKSQLIQTITYRLPKIIAFQNTLSDTIFDLQQQRDDWCSKYKKVFENYESKQLQNDKLKMQIVCFSQNYEHLSIAFEEIKYKYCEIKQRQLQLQEIKKNEVIQKLAQDNTSRNNQHSSNSEGESYRDVKMETDVMKEEKELFLQEIRQSQKQIITLKQTAEELAEERQKLLKQNEQLCNLLKGEKARSDRLDRQILQILNKNEDLKIEKLQANHSYEMMKKAKEDIAVQLEQQKKRKQQIASQKDRIVQELTETKAAVANLTLQNSREREKYCLLQDQQRDLKSKVNQMKKENQLMRSQTDKLLIKLAQTKQTMSRDHLQQVNQIRKQYEQYRNRSKLKEREQRGKNLQKLQQISKMHKEITSKLQQKVRLLQKDSRQKKEKIGQMKFQIERLYQSLQIQVQKEFKNNDQTKQILHKYNQIEQKYRSLEDREKNNTHNQHQMEEQITNLKKQLNAKDKKILKSAKIYDRLRNLVLPKLKEQMYTIRIACQHFCKIIQMEKQQTSFLLQKRHEQLTQLIEQALLQSAMVSQKTNIVYQNELQKWKDHCKSYEEKYCQLKQSNESLQQKYIKLEKQNNKQIQEKDALISKIMSQLEDQKNEHINTVRMVQRLKQKCRQVEQYYKLVQSLSRQNQQLKSKLQNSYNAFSSPEKIDFQQTSKQPRSTVEQSSLKYSKTIDQKKLRQEYDIKDLVSRAQSQKARLQAVQKQYKTVNSKYQ